MQSYRPIRLLQVCVIALVISATYSGCTQHRAQETTRTFLKFGTLIDITLYDVEPVVAEDLLDKLEEKFNQFHANWSPWEEKSDLSKLNRAIKAGETITVPVSLRPLIEQSIALSNMSNGLFNPAIGELIQLWQFHKHNDPDIHPPDKNLVSAIVDKNPSMNDLVLKGTEITCTNKFVQLNFGAFAKGYSIDLAKQFLIASGVKNAVINTGGDLGVIGDHGTRPWKIGIRDPRKNNIIAWLEVDNNENVFTSGDYERFYIYKNKRYHHILDPRTGYPSTGASSVTVISDNAGLADAAATAIFIAGEKEWENIAKAMHIDQVMLIDENNKVHMTPKMAGRVHFVEDVQPELAEKPAI